MKLTLPEQLSQFTHLLQAELFPRIEPESGVIDERAAVFVAACVLIPFQRFIPVAASTGRPPKHRVAMARAFLAKSLYNLPDTRHLIAYLHLDSTLRKLCGWLIAAEIPHESTFSRAFAEFAASELPQFVHTALIRATLGTRLLGHIARDSTAIEARERFPERQNAAAVRGSKAAKSGKGGGKARKPRKRTHRPEEEAETRIERQLLASSTEQMLADVPTQCSLGGKRGSNGQIQYWRGYKLHVDVADGQIPVSALLTSASVHDSQVAIPLMHESSAKVTYLYELMDSAYDAAGIHRRSRELGHVPIIDPHTRAAARTQLPCRVKPQTKLDPAERQRFAGRTMVERVFSRLKDEFGACNARVRGAAKLMAHQMFAILALTVDQLLRLSR